MRRPRIIDPVVEKRLNRIGLVARLSRVERVGELPLVEGAEIDRGRRQAGILHEFALSEKAEKAECRIGDEIDSQRGEKAELLRI